MVCTKRERNFAAVVKVMFDNVPEDPLAREAIGFLVMYTRENIVQVGGCPASEGRINHLPRGLKPANQLSGTSWGCVRFIPFFQWSNLSTAFAHEHVEPTSTS